MIPFSPPRIDTKTLDEVNKALLSGWITTGPRTKLFEKGLVEYCSVPAVLCVNSASAGLELVLRWFGVKEGDEVIVPAYTYAATANVVVHCGAKPVFVDVCDDFTISVEAIRNAVNERTKVIMPVDLGGYPCHYEAINSMVREQGLKGLFKPGSPAQESLGRVLVLSDAAHSIGADYQGSKTGALTDISVFSFHAVKNLTTAEGGAICLNLPAPFDNQNVYSELNIKSLHGQTKDALAKTQAGNWKYDIIEPGYKCNMTDIQAAIGLVELERYEETLAKRKHIFERYHSAFANDSRFIVPEYESLDRTSSYHLYLLRIKGIGEELRDRIMQEIFSRQVAVNVHYIPLAMMTWYKKAGYDIKDYPVTYHLFESEISLPVYYNLTDEQIETVISAVKESVDAVI